MCKKEEYDTGDITFKWKNKGSIEGIVNKWIISFMNGDDKITDDMEITKDSRPDLLEILQIIRYKSWVGIRLLVTQVMV